MTQYRQYVPGFLLFLMLLAMLILGQERFIASEEPLLPIGDWVVVALDYVVDNYRDFFQALRQPFAFVLGGIEDTLKAASPLLLLILVGLVTWQISDIRVATLVAGCFFVIGAIGAWTGAMTTLSIVVTCVLFCALLGIPLGILAARSDRFEAILRPLLDLLQTIPSFVYLVPIVSLFGIGNVPGVIVTIIYALSPVIRLTNLGIRQVQADMVEASHAFGASESQTLFKVQIPQAMPTIMAGINQTIMMSLAMTVVASMISVTGLGQMVLRGIGRLDMGIATIGGLGIVLLAIAVDRFSQSLGISGRERGYHKWYERGPIGILYSLASRSAPAK